MQLVFLIRPHAPTCKQKVSIQPTTLQIHALQNPKDNMYRGGIHASAIDSYGYISI